MAYRVQFEQWIAAPLDRVFGFFADPTNLPRIMPAWMQVRIEEAVIVAPPDGPRASLESSFSQLAGAGSRLVASYRAVPCLPFRIHSEARIVGFARNAFFVDMQGQGPFHRWHHRHEFAAEARNGTAGTRLNDHIEYEIGWEPLGRVVDALLIAPQMRRTFAYRQEAAERLLRGQV